MSPGHPEQSVYIHSERVVYAHRARLWGALRALMLSPYEVERASVYLAELPWKTVHLPTLPCLFVFGSHTMIYSVCMGGPIFDYAANSAHS